MGTVLIDLLPMILASALVPVGLIINTILLMGENGKTRSAAFIAGITLSRLIQGALFGFIFGAASDASNGPSPVTSTLLLVAGVVFLIKGVKTFLKEPDPDDPPPKWMTAIDSLTAGKLFLIGAGWVMVAIKLWVFTLAALNIIRDADLGVTPSVIAYVIFAIGAVILMLVPLIMYIVAPAPTAGLLAKFRVWLEKNNRGIMIVVSAVFGVYFLYKGISGLLY